MDFAKVGVRSEDVLSAGLDGGRLTACQEKSVSRSSHEFCAFVGGII